ncbi:efflux RND transporter periplasmic adaptor subunit [Sphingomonas abietis]|uniref:Efflux RND transporter periplasmic adaptor subunit n=1 Tax=Sphingomonas abietis TaxID=3012344 RepID=A0ABY7NVT0_9SPHN|nr:efflux RND transporter periplasmic adaptor subunit [Sphingomonas abietis]WBO24541.1 efflux RND transporter periplasmic adaptor subunit [Sphingomonas abietis]
MPHAPHARVAIAAILFGSLAACGSQQPQKAPPPPEVGIVTLQSQSVTLSTNLPGRVAAAETSEVRPQVSGIIRRRLFEEGSIVHTGQLLYQIEDAPYRAALGTAQGNLANAQATIRSTQLQADRYGRLLAIKGVSQQDADNAQAAAQQARAGVQAQRAAVDAARVNLGFTQIRAPITGRIGRSLITVGALAQTGQSDPLATIQRMNMVYVDVTESAADMLDLRQAMQAGSITRDGPGAARVQLLLPNGTTYPIEGRFEFSDVTVDPSSGSVTIRASFPNPDGLLLPGMYVRAKLVEGTRRQAILAPQQGITRDEQGNAVAMVVDAQNKVEQRKVTTEQAVGDKWVVSSGLKPGDRLIVEGLLMLKPGEQVQPRAPQQVVASSADSASGQSGN